MKFAGFATPQGSFQFGRAAVAKAMVIPRWPRPSTSRSPAASLTVVSATVDRGRQTVSRRLVVPMAQGLGPPMSASSSSLTRVGLSVSSSA